MTVPGSALSPHRRGRGRPDIACSRRRATAAPDKLSVWISGRPRHGRLVGLLNAGRSGPLKQLQYILYFPLFKSIIWLDQRAPPAAHILQSR